ncbi:hypothetical protein M0802_008695 [Mischocyttarus mexicanus]|nr:hypothetical protein M0802_008695 [Mischocyttarus mexicanus]
MGWRASQWEVLSSTMNDCPPGLHLIFMQCVYFPKYVRDLCLQLGICGWVKNSKTGTILGKMEGPRAFVDQMTQWLSTVGSPGSEIDHCELTMWANVTRRSYKGFAIRF